MNLENFKEAYLTVINEEIEETEVVETEVTDVDEETPENELSAADHFKMGVMALMGKMDASEEENEMINDLVASIISDLNDSMSGD
jgi:hypothetical protein